jgi:hypothetical protein
MSWFCRIGLHRWVDVYRWAPVTYFFGFRAGPGFTMVAEKCRRCGKRRRA